MPATQLLSSQQCETLYGDPTKEHNMGFFDIPEELRSKHLAQKRIYCNKDLAPLLKQALINLKDIGALDDLVTFDGCFNIRLKRGGSSSSLHSWGMAVDFNAATNRFGQRPTMPRVVIECFQKAGFDWGGDWKTQDGMHFQVRRDRVPPSKQV
jgi:hypothetical protein